MDSLNMHSPDLTERNIERLAELFPSVVTETRDASGEVKRAIDFDLLRQELSDHVVEGPQERYQLDWPGKREALFAANAPIAKTLRPQREESVDFDTTKNIFIEGDNLDALKLLQESYLGKIKLIYIDPPYNTGHDFVYNDDFAQTSAEYMERSGQRDETGAGLQSNPESNGRFHSDWLSMMYPRLKLARNLLADNGIILVSIDDNEMSRLRSIMDEIFGASNFFAELVVIRAEGGGLAKRVVKGHDYLLAFTRDFSQFRGMFRKKDIRGEIVQHNGGTYWIETDWLREKFGAYGTLNYEDILEVKGQEKLDEINEGLADGRYRLIPRGDKHIVGRLRDLTQDGTKFYSVIKHLNKDAKKSLEPLGLASAFSNPKPLSLLLDIILGATRFSPNNSDIILDFFSGSGTTAHATLAANAEDDGNRRYITVQISEHQEGASLSEEFSGYSIPKIARERMKRAGTAVGKEHPHLDTGFRSFRIDSTNMADTFRTPDELSQQELSGLIDAVKKGRTGEDLLFQVMLNWGLEISLPIERETIGGKEVFTVDEDVLIACFAPEVTTSLVTEIAQRKPLRAVFRDTAFTSDSARINAEQVFREVSPITDVKVI